MEILIFHQYCAHDVVLQCNMMALKLVILPILEEDP
jgi:hypothetical protein